MILSALLLALPAPLSGDITGTVMYEDKPFNYGTGYTGAYPQKPVRFADVDIETSGGSVLASGSTDENGAFSIFVPDAGPLDIQVRVKTRSNNAATGNSRLSFIKVQDFNSGSIFALLSPVFSGVSGNLDIGTMLAARQTTTNNKEGNAFNLFDITVDAIMYMTDPAVGGLGLPGQTLTVRWLEPNGSAYASGTTYVMGYQLGYDDTIGLHEAGHVIHNMYSSSSNPGGSHFLGDSDQDPRLSYGEGYASFFSGCVRQWNGTSDPGFYMNSNGNPGSGGWSFGWRYENDSPYNAVGDADEVAVCDLLWDIVDGENTADNSPGSDDDPVDENLVFAGGLTGERMWQEMFTGPLDGGGTKTMVLVWKAFFTPVDYGNRDELVSVFDDFNVRYWNDDFEPDNSRPEASIAWPIPNGFWRDQATLYFSDTAPFAPGLNDNDWTAFNADAGASITLRTRYPNNLNDAGTMADTFLELRDAVGNLVASSDDGGTGRNARIDHTATEAGTYYAVVKTNHSYRKYGRYQLSIAVSSRPPLWWSGNNQLLTDVSINLQSDANSGYAIFYSLRTDSVSTPEGTLLLRNPKQLFMGNMPTNGKLSITATIPNKAALVGRSVYLQALVGSAPQYTNRIELPIQ